MSSFTCHEEISYSYESRTPSPHVTKLSPTLAAPRVSRCLPIVTILALAAFKKYHQIWECWTSNVSVPVYRPPCTYTSKIKQKEIRFNCKNKWPSRNFPMITTIWPRLGLVIISKLSPIRTVLCILLINSPTNTCAQAEYLCS